MERLVSVNMSRCIDRLVCAVETVFRQVFALWKKQIKNAALLIDLKWVNALIQQRSKMTVSCCKKRREKSWIRVIFALFLQCSMTLSSKVLRRPVAHMKAEIFGRFLCSMNVSFLLFTYKVVYCISVKLKWLRSSK